MDHHNIQLSNLHPLLQETLLGELHLVSRIAPVHGLAHDSFGNALKSLKQLLHLEAKSPLPHVLLRSTGAHILPSPVHGLRPLLSSACDLLETIDAGDGGDQCVPHLDRLRRMLPTRYADQLYLIVARDARLHKHRAHQAAPRHA